MSAIYPTCLPWQTKHDFDIEGSTAIIGNVDGEIIDGTTHHTFDFVARTLDLEDDSQSHSVAVANAVFIVRACNSHAALVEAIKPLLAIIDEGVSVNISDAELQAAHPEDRRFIKRTRAAVATARAALARATGAA